MVQRLTLSPLMTLSTLPMAMPPPKVTYDDTSKTSKVVYDVNVDDTTIEVKDKKLGVKPPH